MAIATRVIGDALVTAGVTLVHMTAQSTLVRQTSIARITRRCSGDSGWMSRKSEPVLAEDVGHLQRWSHAQKLSALTGYARSSSGLSVARTVFGRDTGVDLRGTHAAMTE